MLNDQRTVVFSSETFLHLNASLINLARSYKHSDDMILINFWTVGHEHGPKYLDLIELYLEQHKIKWNSDSTAFWLHNLHNLSFLSTLLYLPNYISKQCEPNLKCVICFLKLSFDTTYKYFSKQKIRFISAIQI